ncbi:MAG TPA: hypothetical protein PKG71_01660 [Candidatus Woesebacteria bacterium]|nr:hypothetical protein [Candidatus Woesebacteria bacterium]HNS94651.1 hypothetical protein [Candidatus Woesebacteria bacterium]
MDKDSFIQLVLQKGKDNSRNLYLSGFFFVLILLILFVARPTVGEYVDRKRQLEELVALSIRYQKAIENVSELQSILEAHRQDFKMLDEAIPNDLHLYGLTQDVNRSFLQYTPSKSYTFPAHSITTSNSSKKPNPKAELKTYKILADVRVDYGTGRYLIDTILSQRRLKSINTLVFSRVEEASPGGVLQMKLEIDAYHL